MLLSSLLVAGAVFANAQESKRQWINRQIKSMTLRQQIAQLFVVACYPARGEKHISEISDIICNEQIGGIIWGECSPTIYVETLNRLQSQVNIPLLVTMDAEWGVAMRLDSVIKFPQQLTLGAIQDNSLIYQFGLEVAEQCRKTGVHFNFAPVVDVNNNPNNPVINMRSFGENKYKVTEKAYAYMKGMQDGGILTCLKHFPGHGDTDKDSHKELPTITHDKKHINDTELYPFRKLIKYGATGVMTAHLQIPALCKNNIPASQSKEICTDLLQKKMKFKGLTVTDALEMKGALYNRDTSKVALYSLIAGNNILEIPVDIKKSIDEIEKAVKNGEVSERYIKKNCKKILAAKYDAGLHKGFNPVNPQGILEKLNTEQAKALRFKLAETSLTLLSNKNILPLNSTKIKYIEIGNGNAFKKQLKQYCEIDTIRLKPNGSKENIDSIAANLADAQTIITGYHNTHSRPYTNFGTDTLTVDFIDNLAASKNVILIFFGNPYAIAKFKNYEKFAAIIVAYDNSDEAQICSANAVLGKQKFSGKLPVSINEQYKEDFGIID
jgi:beta-glucosidase-like glycosyl hydrolase